MAAPAIGRRRRWAPKVSSRIDTTHPLAARLISAFVPVPGYGAVDIHGGQDLALRGTPSLSMTRFGRGMECTAVNNGASRTVGTTGRLALQPPITMLWVGRLVGTPTGYAPLFTCTYDTADNNPYVCYAINFNSAGTTYEVFSNDAGSLVSAAGGTPTTGKDVVLVATFTSTGLGLWENNVLVAGESSTSSISYSSESIVSLNYYAPGGRNSNQVCNFGAIWNRELFIADVGRLTADPFCFVKT